MPRCNALRCVALRCPLRRAEENGRKGSCRVGPWTEPAHNCVISPINPNGEILFGSGCPFLFLAPPTVGLALFIGNWQLENWHWQPWIFASCIELSVTPSAHRPMYPTAKRALWPWHPTVLVPSPEPPRPRFNAPYIVPWNSAVVSMAHHLPGPWWSILDGALGGDLLQASREQSTIGDF